MFKKFKTEKNIKQFLNWGILGLLFLLPWQTRLILKAGELNDNFWEYGTFALYIVDILAVIVLLVGLDYFVEYVFEKYKFKKNIWIFLAFIFLAWTFSSSFWSLDRELSFYWTLRLGIAIGLSFVISIIRPKLKHISLALLASGIIQSVLAIWQFVAQEVYAFSWLGIASQKAIDLGVSVIEIGDERWLRAYGSFPHPNILAGFLVVSILALIYLASNYKSPIVIREKCINPSVFLYFLPILLLGLGLTFSKAGALSLIVALFLLLVLVFIKNRDELKDFKKVFLVLIFCGIVFGFVFQPFLKQRADLGARLEKKSINERQFQIEAGHDLFFQKQFSGHGVANFTLAWHQKNPELNAWDYQPAHNKYILILTELGIIGAGLFFVLIFLRLFNQPLNKREHFFKLIIFLALIFLAIFDHYWWTLNSTLLLWWLAFGML